MVTSITQVVVFILQMEFQLLPNGLGVQVSYVKVEIQPNQLFLIQCVMNIHTFKVAYGDLELKNRQKKHSENAKLFVMKTQVVQDLITLLIKQVCTLIIILVIVCHNHLMILRVAILIIIISTFGRKLLQQSIAIPKHSHQ